MTEEIHVKLIAVEVARLKLEPGDVLLVNTSANLPEAVLTKIRQQLEKTFPGHQILIMAGDGGLSIIQKGGT